MFESLLCMDSKSQSKIEFKSMKPLVVREMIQFLYCGKIKKFEFLPDLLLAADNVSVGLHLMLLNFLHVLHFSMKSVH